MGKNIYEVYLVIDYFERDVTLVSTKILFNIESY